MGRGRRPPGGRCSPPPRRHGLAPLVGSSPTVGAVGYTLGGGLGWLARRYGPACDAVRSFEVVTPDGELVRRQRHASTRSCSEPCAAAADAAAS